MEDHEIVWSKIEKFVSTLWEFISQECQWITIDDEAWLDFWEVEPWVHQATDDDGMVWGGAVGAHVLGLRGHFIDNAHGWFIPSGMLANFDWTKAKWRRPE